MGKLTGRRVFDSRDSKLLVALFLSCALAGAESGCAKGSNARTTDRKIDDAGVADANTQPLPNDGDADVLESPDGQVPADAHVEVPSDSGVVLGYESREAYCAGEGSPVEVRVPGTADGDVTEQICTTGLASRIFQFGICSCSDLHLPGAFSIDAMDSDHPEDTNKSGASIGTNGEFTTQGNLLIRGSLIASGGGTLGIAGTSIAIDGNVRTNAHLDVQGAGVAFRRDLWVNGHIAAAGTDIGVTGDLYQTAGHTLSPTLAVGGTAHTSEIFSVAEPCACGEEDIINIPAIVADGKAHNHNADIGLAQDATLSMQGTGGLTLDCGRFAFGTSAINGSNNTLTAHGRTAIFIDGDLAIAGDFGVDVGAEGELDIFISGNLRLSGSGTVGSKTRPAALRFYVAGSDAIDIKGAMVFAANLYAPRALVNLGGTDDIYGSLFAKDVEVSGTHDMHYDRAIMNTDGGDRCEPPSPPPPPPPGDVECDDDLDCDPALLCESGECTAVIHLL